MKQCSIPRNDLYVLRGMWGHVDNNYEALWPWIYEHPAALRDADESGNIILLDPISNRY